MRRAKQRMAARRKRRQKDREFRDTLGDVLKRMARALHRSGYA